MSALHLQLRRLQRDYVDLPQLRRWLCPLRFPVPVQLSNWLLRILWPLLPLPVALLGLLWVGYNMYNLHLASAFVQLDVRRRLPCWVVRKWLAVLVLLVALCYLLPVDLQLHVVRLLDLLVLWLLPRQLPAWNVCRYEWVVLALQRQLCVLFGSPNHLHVLLQWPSPLQRCLLRCLPIRFLFTFSGNVRWLLVVVLYVCQLFPHLQVVHIWIFPVRFSVLGQLPRWNHASGCSLSGLPVPLWHLLGNIQHMYSLCWGLLSLR